MKKLLLEIRVIPSDWRKMITKSSITLSNGMIFMCVPAGKFVIGSKKGYSHESPEHIIEIPYDFWMLKFPVTNEQYSEFVSVNKNRRLNFNWEEKSHPVIEVSWFSAVEYCSWVLNIIKTEIPSGLIIRLPTEAEWEKSARGIDGRIYPWGNEFDRKKCNSLEGDNHQVVSVDFYSPYGDSPYGCADMAGNVWEWTHSDYKDYPYNIRDGRENEQENDKRVVRGGSCANYSEKLTCSSRGWNDPHSTISPITGFRICLAPPLPK